MSQRTFNPSRRQLFRGDTGTKRLPIRPPWSLAETDFIRDCSRCGDCIAQCPEAILVKGSGGFPEVNFQQGECSFCGDCVVSCSAAVFKPIDTAPWSHKAVIGEGCITRQQVVCRSCIEQCEPEALSLTLQLGGVGIPSIDTELCNGCGACVVVCPTQAISIQQPKHSSSASSSASFSSPSKTNNA